MGIIGRPRGKLAHDGVVHSHGDVFRNRVHYGLVYGVNRSYDVKMGYWRRRRYQRRGGNCGFS